MTERELQRLLEHAIMEDRGDAAPWLVYGDWLQARGDPRGELINIEQALRSAKTVSERAELTEAKAKIIAKNQTEWLGHNLKGMQFQWRWGFVNEAIVKSPGMNQLTSLLKRKSMRFLRSLKIFSGEIRMFELPDMLEGLQLERLELFNCNVGDGGAEIIASAPVFSGLSCLMLDRNSISEEGVWSLGLSSFLSSLSKLSLASNRLDERAAWSFTQCEWSKLKEVDLCDNSFDAESAQMLRSFCADRAITLSMNPVTE